MNKVIPIPEHRQIVQRMLLQQWRMNRMKSYASKTGRSLEGAINHIRQRFGNTPLSQAVDEVIAELDAVVDPMYHSSKEPVIH